MDESSSSLLDTYPVAATARQNILQADALKPVAWSCKASWRFPGSPHICGLFAFRDWPPSPGAGGKWDKHRSAQLVPCGAQSSGTGTGRRSPRTPRSPLRPTPRPGIAGLPSGWGNRVPLRPTRQASTIDRNGAGPGAPTGPEGGARGSATAGDAVDVLRTAGRSREGRPIAISAMGLSAAPCVPSYCPSIPMPVYVWRSFLLPNRRY